jgi:hypothetical protein
MHALLLLLLERSAWVHVGAVRLRQYYAVDNVTNLVLQLLGLQFFSNSVFASDVGPY